MDHASPLTQHLYRRVRGHSRSWRKYARAICAEARRQRKPAARRRTSASTVVALAFGAIAAAWIVVLEVIRGL